MRDFRPIAAPLFLCLLLLSCAKPKVEQEKEPDRPLDEATVESLSPMRMRAHTEVLADDARGGRIPGSYGHWVARDYIQAEMREIGLVPVGIEDSFLFPYDNEPREDRYQALADGTVVPQEVEVGYDIVGMIPGSDPERAGEYLVVMAHYDHLGVNAAGEVYNGAFDNAAAVAMSLEIARVFLSGDVTLGRSIIFLFTDDEESGLDGSRAWIEDATVPVEDIVLGISADPLGRPLLPDYFPMVLIGLERSPALEERFRELAWLSDVDVHFIHRDVVPVFSSDQDSFYNASWPVPALWMTNPGFSFYHTVDDTAETIDYRMLLADGRFLAQVLAFFANDTERFDYLGPTEPGTQAAEDAAGLFSAVLDSELLSESEREQAEYFQTELEGVIEAGSMDALRHPESFFTAALYFLLFELGWAHPGEIPPPFPGDR